MHILERKSKSNHLSFHLRKLKKEREIKPKGSRRKDMRVRADINEIKDRKPTEKTSKIKRWFFEKINKTNKPLGKLRKRREDTKCYCQK